MTRIGAVIAFAVTLLLTVPTAQAGRDSTATYRDAATNTVAAVLHGTHRTAWPATTLDCCTLPSYTGPRHAVLVKIPRGHGTRWVGIIHVPAGRGAAARDALAAKGVWFVGKGTRFVLPLESSTDTSGEASGACSRAAHWAAGLLGDGWVITGP